MKKLLRLLIIVVLSISMVATFSLAGCKGTEEEATTEEETTEEEATVEEETTEEEAGSEAEQYEVAVCFPGTVEFFSVERKGLDSAAEDYNIKPIYSDAEWDAGKQLSQVEDFVARGVDMILLCAADNEALIPAIKACNDAGIPLITFTNPVGEDPEGKYEGLISYIGTNEVKVGNLLGEMAEQLLGDEEGKIVLIEGNPGTPPQRMRRQGFEEIMATHPNWEIVYSQAIEGWTKEGALTMMEDFLQTGQDFNFISTQYVNLTVGAAQALDEAGIDDVFLTGIEFNKEIAPLVESGRVDITSYYSVEDTGYKTMEIAAKYLMGESVPQFVEVVHEIVTKDNVGDYEPEI
ncbi:MAG: sugar ABC transporter substrate-binding protein [Actinomycetota bacterium]|nr:sugar ABC transporter substrate-binding protein [Actinomycetota bacterium]